METSQDLNFLTALLPLAAVIFIIALGVILLNQHFHKNLYRQKLEREELKNRHQQELLRSSIHIQEEERKRIASDLHDELGATLSIARMHLVQIEQQHRNKAESFLSSLQNVRNLTEAALSSMRRISHELMPPQLETFGLIRTLEDVASQLNDISEAKLQITTLPDQPRLPWSAELGLYRISMELINNTLKHAKASEIKFNLQYTNNNIILLYSDNGKGLSEDSLSQGAGLKNIEARVSSLRGSLTMSNNESGSFCASIKIPVSVMKPEKGFLADKR